MDVVHGLDHLTPLARSVLTIGNFDGVHAAHQALLTEARRLGDAHHLPVVACTFDPHPLAILPPQRPPPVLTPLPEKLRQLAYYGADLVVIIASDMSLLSLGPEPFVRDIVVPKFHPAHVVEGDSFRFGRGRAGDLTTMSSLAGECGFHVHRVAPVFARLPGVARSGLFEALAHNVVEDRFVVSSSLVRQLLTAGLVAPASRCLARPYAVLGKVIRGQGRGKAIGFPTANLSVPGQLVPGEAVYAGWAHVENLVLACAISIGKTPTFNGTATQVEAHMLRFADAAALSRQLVEDVAAVEAMLLPPNEVRVC